MVSVSLIFIIISTVFTVSTMAFRIFRKETKEYLQTFDVHGYLVRLDRILGSASQIKMLRNYSGFYALKLDNERRIAREIIHFARNKQLFLVDRIFTWREELRFEKGEAIFPSIKIITRKKTKILLKGVESVTMNIRPTTVKAGKSQFSVMEVVFTMKGKNGRKIMKRFPLGGHNLLTSRIPYLFQDAVDD